MHNDLVFLADSASLDVVSDPIVHSRPLVDLFSFPYCFISAWMSRCHMIVGVGHNRAEEIVSWFVNSYDAANM